jgi:vacuolar-type H+-ATPase catalytic subunit A/Vma1
MGKVASEQISQLFNRVDELENALQVIKHESKKDENWLIYDVAKSILEKYDNEE